MIASKDDGFARILAGFVLNAVFHQVAQNRPIGIPIEDLFIDLMVFIVKISRIFAILFELLLLIVKATNPLKLSSLKILQNLKLLTI